MLCHNGKVSLAGFIYAILSTVATSLVVFTLLPSDTRTSYSLAICVVVPIVIHGISNVIAYFVTNDEDFSVNNTTIELSAYKNDSFNHTTYFSIFSFRY